MERRVIYLNVNVQPIQFQWQHSSLCNHDIRVTWPLNACISFSCCIVSLVAVLLERSKSYFDIILRETIHIYCFIKQCLQSEMIWRQNVLLKQKVMLISCETRDEQTDANTKKPASLCSRPSRCWHCMLKTSLRYAGLLRELSPCHHHEVLWCHFTNDEAISIKIHSQDILSIFHMFVAT